MLKQIGRLISGRGPGPWVPAFGASAHLDFINRKYYWDGAEREEADFTTFTGATFGTGADAGLIGTGIAADHDITLNWSALNIFAPFVMAVVFRPKLLNGTTQMIANIEAATSASSNRTQYTINGSNAAVHQTITGGVTQAFQGSGVLTVDTNVAMATLVQTNLLRNSVNGATAGAEDTAATLPTYSLLRLLEAIGNNFPFTGRIRHILFFTQVGGSEISQVNLNALSDALSRY